MDRNSLPILNPLDLELPTADAPIGRGDATRKRLPEWIRTTLPTGEGLRRYQETAGTVSGNILHTVCEEARCPNVHDCWGRGTATFMIAGKDCTRGCKFCSVETTRTPEPLDFGEPDRLAEAVVAMGLSHAVITVVNRDDVADGGAGHYRRCVLAVRRASPGTTIELLCSDLSGDRESLRALLFGADPERPIPAAPSVFAHNVECVPRLDKIVRDPRASFRQSLSILSWAREMMPELVTKSSIMVGLGETDDEVVEAMRLLRSVDVNLLTIGQYLQPTPKHLVVDRFVEPGTFDRWSATALELGFDGAACGPMVRSSYRAESLLAAAKRRLAQVKSDQLD